MSTLIFICHSLTFHVQVIIERWRQGSPDDFWNEFTDAQTNKFLSVTVILARLRAERKSSDAELAQAAQNMYGDDFNQLFRYTKGGREQVMTRVSSIAKRFRELEKDRLLAI